LPKTKPVIVKKPLTFNIFTRIGLITGVADGVVTLLGLSKVAYVKL